MTWTRLDDIWGEDLENLLPDNPDACWHYLMLVQRCSRNDLRDGVLQASLARRASFVRDPDAALAALVMVGLLEHDGIAATYRVVHIDEHLPSDKTRQRAEDNKLNKARFDRCNDGDHSLCLTTSKCGLGTIEPKRRGRPRRPTPAAPGAAAPPPRTRAHDAADEGPPRSNVTPLPSREHVNAPSAGWIPGDRDQFHSWVEHDQALVCDLQLILTGEHTRPDDWIITNLEGNVTRFTELVRSMPREELEAVDCRALRTVAAGEVVRQAIDHTQAEPGPAGPSTDDPTPPEQDPREPWGAPWGTISTRPVPVDNPKGTTT